MHMIHKVTDLSPLPPADQQAIGKTLFALLEAFRERNADALRTVYADDADWRNGFGTAKRGVSEIVDYLREVFAQESFNRGDLAVPPNATFRVVTPEVVVVSTHAIVRDKVLEQGGYLDRDNFSLRVLQRRDDGSWRIISEMFHDSAIQITTEA